MVQQLPEGTSVVTQIREPLDRFLSAYEFAIEVRMRARARLRLPAGAAGELAGSEHGPGGAPAACSARRPR